MSTRVGSAVVGLLVFAAIVCGCGNSGGIGGMLSKANTIEYRGITFPKEVGDLVAADCLPELQAAAVAHRLPPTLVPLPAALPDEPGKRLDLVVASEVSFMYLETGLTALVQPPPKESLCGRNEADRADAVYVQVQLLSSPEAAQSGLSTQLDLSPDVEQIGQSLCTAARAMCFRVLGSAFYMARVEVLRSDSGAIGPDQSRLFAGWRDLTLTDVAGVVDAVAAAQ